MNLDYRVLSWVCVQTSSETCNRLERTQQLKPIQVVLQDPNRRIEKRRHCQLASTLLGLIALGLADSIFFNLVVYVTKQQVYSIWNMMLMMQMESWIWAVDIRLSNSTLPTAVR